MSKKDAPPVERPRFAARIINGHVVGDDPWSQEVIDKLPPGRMVYEVFQEEAEDGVRGLYFAGINMLFQNVDGTGPGGEWPTPESLRREILREIGFTDPIFRVDGIKKEPRSMARGRMQYDELVVVLEVSRAYCVSRWGFDSLIPHSPWLAQRGRCRGRARWRGRTFAPAFRGIRGRPCKRSRQSRHPSAAPPLWRGSR